MTLAPEALAVLGLVVAGGLAWLFANGGALAKTAAVVVGLYMAGTAVGWAATDGELHPITATTGWQFVVVMAAGLAVVRYAFWAVTPLIMVGMVVIAGDGARQLVGGLA